MSWGDILKTSSLSTIHFRNLRKAVIELSDTHSGLLKNPNNYKNEIIDLATRMYAEETGGTSTRYVSRTYGAKWRGVIGRIVNSIKKERGIK